MIHEVSPREVTQLANRVTELERHIQTLMDLVQSLVGSKGQAQAANVATKPVDPEVIGAFYQMTPKQHIALQMMVAGCSNLEIGKKLGVTENTAKVHVRSVFDKMKARTRTQVVGKAIPALEAISPEDYLVASGGIPVDWSLTYRLKGDDPCKVFYL